MLSDLTLVKDLEESIESQLLPAFACVQIPLLVLRSRTLDMNSVPQLEIRLRLLDDLLILRLADRKAFFNETITTHHHMNRASKQISKAFQHDIVLPILALQKTSRNS